MTFTVERIDHVEVFVADIEAAARWYRDVLGLEEIHRWDPEPLMIGAGGTRLALFRAEPDAAPAEGQERGDSLRWHRVAWRTSPEDFAAAPKHLASLGIRFRGPIDHGIARSIYFEDPDGHPLEITCDVSSTV